MFMYDINIQEDLPNIYLGFKCFEYIHVYRKMFWFNNCIHAVITFDNDVRVHHKPWIFVLDQPIQLDQRELNREVEILSTALQFNSVILGSA